MPESKIRKEAAEKKKQTRSEEDTKARADRQRRAVAAPGSRRWVPPTFITVGLLGVLWLIVYYVGGQYLPFMITLGGWNILIGMGCMAASFALATLWK